MNYTNQAVITVLFYTILIVLLIRLISLSKNNIASIIHKILSLKIKKASVVKYYGVDKTTFRKWIEHFCSDVFPDIKEYNKRRKITFREYLMLLNTLGINDDESVLFKKDIVELGKGTYKSLRESVEKNPTNFGITKTAFENLRVFPPKVGKKILAHYGE